ncbi:MAG: YceI family protein [Planctomycetaceae bacterium]|nr:YceI family protein [Planctomycetales bacterium]MCB9923815.1 YceI family protein [Planctomycetaceae bacterium]
MLGASLSVACLMSLAALSSAFGQSRVASTEQGREPERLTFERGDVYLDSSRVFIHVYKTGLGHEHGVVGTLKQGRILLDAQRGGGELVFDMQSFDADSDQARRYFGLTGSTDASTRQQVNANMHSSSILDSPNHPTAVFRISSISKLAQPSRRNLPQYRLDGEFTLRGTTNPIQVIADVDEKDHWVHLRGGFSILQTNYGITPFTKAFGAVGVADRLEIWGDLWIANDRLVAR